MVEETLTARADMSDPRTRIYLVKVLDPIAKMMHTSVTGIGLDELLDIDARAGLLSMGFAEALLHAAAGRVAERAEGLMCTPDQLEVQWVSEISRRELKALMEDAQQRKALRAEGAS